MGWIVKKIFLCLIIVCLILTGCGKQSEKTVLNEFQDKVVNSDSYYLSGNMELVNNEDVYTYDISVSYKKDDYYKIELTNVINDHKQIILRNEEGVYKRYIYYKSQWYILDEEDDIQLDKIHGMVTYIYIKEKGVYVENES